jgi:hypothetical protein
MHQLLRKREVVLRNQQFNKSDGAVVLPTANSSQQATPGNIFSRK